MTLETDHHDDRRWGLRQLQRRVSAAHNVHEFVVNNLYNQLPRLKAFEHFLPEGTLLHIRDKLLDDLVVNVGLKQRHADFLEAVLHVLLSQFSLTANVLEDAFQLLI